MFNFFSIIFKLSFFVSSVTWLVPTSAGRVFDFHVSTGSGH